MKTQICMILILLAGISLRAQDSKEGKSFTFTNNTTRPATDLHLVLTKGVDPVNLVADPVTGVKRVGGVYENYPTGKKTTQDYKTSRPVAAGASVTIQFDDNTKVKEYWWTENDVMIDDNPRKDASDGRTDNKIPGKNDDLAVISYQPADRAADKALLVTATGTGRTTGHIADITLRNPTDEAIVADFGPCFIPSRDNYQPYIVPSLPAVTVPPHGTANVPVEGYCADIHTPPVPAGADMPPFGEWVRIPADGSGVPAAGWTPAPGSGWEPLPVATAPTVPEPMNPPGGGRRVALIPGTNTPLGYSIDINAYPEEAAPVLLDAIRRIGDTYDSLRAKGTIRTPFSGNDIKEREAVIQQTFWMYTATLTGDDYKVEDFKKNTIEQYESASGTKFTNAPPAVQQNITQGVDDFWNTFQAVGAEAKVLSKEPVKCTCTRIKDGELQVSSDCPIHRSTDPSFKH